MANPTPQWQESIMNEEVTARLTDCVLDHTRRWSLLAMGWAGYQQHGSGAVVIAACSLKAYFVPTRVLNKLLDSGNTLDDACKDCATYDPQKTIVLVYICLLYTSP